MVFSEDLRERHDQVRFQGRFLRCKDPCLTDEAARLGFTTTSISQTVFSGFAGYPVSTCTKEIIRSDVVLRLEEKYRRNTGDLEDIYLQSPATGASVPLRQIADLSYQWQPGRIIHRNGVTNIKLSRARQKCEFSHLSCSRQSGLRIS